MARKAEGNSPPSTSAARATANSLRNIRNQIDKLDLQIVKLISERANLAAAIGKIKNEQGDEVFSPAREEEVLQNVIHAHEKYKSPLDPSCTRAIFREIMSGSRALQKLLRVAYLGPEHSFSHQAAIERFGQTVELKPVTTIAAVYEEINRGHADFGVVPLENSTDGRVADTLEMFLRMPHMVISAEVRLAIHHNLLVAPGTEFQDIRRIYSKAQALSQCRNWLSKHLQSHVALHEVASTTTAADLASKEPGAAAIASQMAAVRYGLRILAAGIEDSPYNETRFAVIGSQKAAKTGTDKTAVMFRLAHQPGSLHDALDVFKQNKINLTWIESFPARTPKPEYIFFVDFEGHREDAKVSRALKALEEHCQELTVLGSYPAATTCG